MKKTTEFTATLSTSPYSYFIDNIKSYIYSAEDSTPKVYNKNTWRFVQLSYLHVL